MVDVQAFGVSRKSVMTAAGLVLTAVIVIGSIAFVGGPHFANAQESRCSDSPRMSRRLRSLQH